MRKLGELLIELDQNEVQQFWSCFTNETLDKFMSSRFAQRLPDASYAIIATFNGVTLCTRIENLTDAVFECLERLMRPLKK